MASFVKIQSAFVCFSLLSSGCEARQYRAEKVLTQGEGKCQINNEDRPRKAVEELDRVSSYFSRLRRVPCICSVAGLNQVHIAVCHSVSLPSLLSFFSLRTV